MKTPPQKLQTFPIAMFSATMGFGGLTLAYKKAWEIFSSPIIIYHCLCFFVSLLFFSILFLYILKFIRHPKAVLEEFNDPIRINFFATISMSLLLLSNIFREWLIFSFILYGIGVVLQTLIAFYVITYWLNKEIEIGSFIPAWFIPVAGNLLVSASGRELVHEYILMFFFSLGIFFWIILTALLFYRIIFHGMLTERFLPTLAIFIAPPAVAMIGYLNVNGDVFDLFAQFLLHIALVFTILLFTLAKNFYKMQFFISWWAFTFPFAALSVSFMIAYEKTQYFLFSILAMCSLILSTIIIAIISYKTILAIRHGEMV